MAENNDIPSIPLPPAAGGVPPVEPTPATPPAPPAPPAPPTPPSVPGAPEPLPPVTAPRPDPYAAPGAAPNPYAQPQAGYVAPPAGYAPGQPYAYAPVAAGPVQGLSIASMILGIASLVLALVGFGFLPGLAAVITGHISQRRQPYARPFWLAGLITGYIGLGISLLTGLVVIVAFIAGITSSSYY